MQNMEQKPSLLCALPPEILVQIFHALPLLALRRCKFVCKAWRSLISDPTFGSGYNNDANSPSPNHSLHVLRIPQSTWYCKAPKVSVTTHEIDTSGNCLVTHHPTLSKYRYMEIIGSCNGLVALYREPGDFYLFNPYTAEDKFVRVDIELDIYVYGLCYDPKSNDYKALLSTFSPHDSFTVLVSFRDGSSKRLAGFNAGNLLGMAADDSSYRLFPNVGTVVNGIPHWVMGCWLGTQAFVVAFDVEREEFKTVAALPNRGEVFSLYMGMIRGKLSVGLVLALDNDYENFRTEVFVMEEYGNAESWSLVFTTPRYIKPLLMMKNNEALVEEEGALMRHNYKDNDSIQVKPKLSLRHSEVITYFPSLASPPP